MNRKKFMIVGSGGRESAFAVKLCEDAMVFAVISHENPTIIDCVTASGGNYLIGNPNNPETVLKFATDNHVDYVFVSADEPLANGVVDVLLKNNIKAIGGIKEATRIEWDKVYSIEMMKKTCPEFTPFYLTVSTPAEIEPAINQFIQQGLSVVVKPQGLTGGKGVKVMPEHLATYQDAIGYATDLLQEKPNEKVLLVEKLHGIEFTIMGITDGTTLVLSPASYDYPFRLDDDLGPGTGGMGCFTNCEKKLPFMTDTDLNNCQLIMQRIIDEMRSNGLIFNGVLNGGFFITSQGIRFMEFNSRFGDPEALNILTILQSSFSTLLENIWDKTLSEDRIKFLKEASVIKYLVAKEYPYESANVINFTVDTTAIKNMGLNVFYAACVKTGENSYQTLKKSRVIAIGATSKSIEEASLKIDQAIELYVTGDLEYRKDIGSKTHLEKLNRILHEMKK